MMSRYRLLPLRRSARLLLPFSLEVQQLTMDLLSTATQAAIYGKQFIQQMQVTLMALLLIASLSVILQGMQVLHSRVAAEASQQTPQFQL